MSESCAHQGAARSGGGAGTFVHAEHVRPSASAEVLLSQGPPVSVVYSSSDASLQGILIGEPTSLEAPDSTAIAGPRTAATSIVGTLAMARRESEILTVIGAGRQAEVHLLAFDAVRPFWQVRVYSRTASAREAFATRMASRLGVDVSPVADPADAIRGADVVLTTTNTVQPVVSGKWLEPGQHVTSIVGGMVGLAPRPPGATGRRELDDEVMMRIGRGDEEFEVATGTARQIAARFPPITNVAATVGLATIGLDATTASVQVDPKAGRKRHEIRAATSSSRVHLVIENAVSANNPRTSTVTPYAVIRRLLDAVSTFVAGT